MPAYRRRGLASHGVRLASQLALDSDHDSAHGMGLTPDAMRQEGSSVAWDWSRLRGQHVEKERKERTTILLAGSDLQRNGGSGDWEELPRRSRSQTEPEVDDLPYEHFLVSHSLSLLTTSRYGQA